jgi:hypothetical protein
MSCVGVRRKGKNPQQKNLISGEKNIRSSENHKKRFPSFPKLEAKKSSEVQKKQDSKD